MKTKTKPKICADCGETWRRDPSPMVIDETWRANGCEPQTMLCDMCLSSNYGWLRPGADPDDIVPLSIRHIDRWLRSAWSRSAGLRQLAGRICGACRTGLTLREK